MQSAARVPAPRPARQTVTLDGGPAGPEHPGRIHAPVLEGTPFSVNGLRGCADRTPLARVAVLAELGETGLPDPRVPGLSPLSRFFGRAAERGAANQPAA